MHILFVAERYPAPDAPLRHVFFHEQALSLRKAGHTVHVICPPDLRTTRQTLRSMRRPGDLFATRETHEGVTVYRMHLGWFPWRFASLRIALLGRIGQRVFNRYCAEQGRPDVIHAHNARFGGSLAVQIKRKHGIPVVLTEHSSVHLRGFRIPPAIIRRALLGADYVFVVGPSLRDAMRNYVPGVNAEILGNSVDVGSFVPAPDWNARSRPFLFSMATRLDKNKAVDIPITAFAHVADADVRLRIGGDGEELESLRQLARQLGVDDKIEFSGALDRTQVRRLFQESHAVVSSSYIETFGMTLIEALACGKPVISTRSGGPDMVINGSNGLLVPPGDPEAMAAAMRQMMTHYDRYDPQRIRADCVAHYGEAAIVARLETVYRDLIAQGSRGRRTATF